MGISQYVTVYIYQRDDKGKLVKRNSTEYKKVKYGRYHLLNRPPMMYIEAEFESGGVVNMAFQRTGPDEYCEYLKKGEPDERGSETEEHE